MVGVRVWVRVWDKVNLRGWPRFRFFCFGLEVDVGSIVDLCHIHVGLRKLRP